MHPSLNELRAELRTLQSQKSLSHRDALRAAEIGELIAETVEDGAERATKAARDAARRAQLAELAEMPEVGTATFKRGDLGGALLAAGWRRGGPAVQVDTRYALETKTGSLADGTDAGDADPARVSSPALGIDQRYLYPRVPTQFVAADATGIQSYRQATPQPGDAVRHDQGHRRHLTEQAGDRHRGGSGRRGAQVDRLDQLGHAERAAAKRWVPRLGEPGPGGRVASSSRLPRRWRDHRGVHPGRRRPERLRGDPLRLGGRAQRRVRTRRDRGQPG